MNYEPIDSSDYDGGEAVNNAVNAFATKYSALAVGNGEWKKVPGKNIFVVSTDHSFDAKAVANTMRGKPFTVIVNGGTVNITSNLLQHAMYVVKNGTINIGTDVKTVSGIFVLNSGAKIYSKQIRNTNPSKPWNRYGQLVINGVVVGGDDSVANLMRARRSVIE